VGDVLLVNLRNASHGAVYQTVRSDGTIDFPLAGEGLLVANQTPDDIAKMLESRIALYTDPNVEVKVREYGSHQITVKGLVDDPGSRNLPREAVPLYVIKAEVGVQSKAGRVAISRGPLKAPETYDLHDADTDNVLVYPGNSLEFIEVGVYFIQGKVVSPGQRDLVAGLTLYQAVAASGGAKGDPKKAIIRRKNDSGVFAVVSHDLRAIKKGKTSDPMVMSGDVIEVKD
jgi:protein involved in polysaccharide export with SLBB domain